MKNTILSLRFAKALLAASLFILGLSRAAAQIDPISEHLHMLDSGSGNVQGGLPGMSCVTPH